ncbi:hypothetical protein PR202_gn00734 [Eleusine coracana subsp. coracana]|uniref:Uncharacterized protein n=1 Tax=Eleusine coracana subsp. coracana TaxID=191504 RepID=A0AAV5G4Q0_ELECO|nr:hypothetical protein PR202_gn00734 [Eleusine coracana subsp. coracana]
MSPKPPSVSSLHISDVLDYVLLVIFNITIALPPFYSHFCKACAGGSATSVPAITSIPRLRNFPSLTPGVNYTCVYWTPSFLLKRYLLTGIRDGPHEPFIADSVDFVVGQVETLSRDDLSSRLMLNVNVASVGSLMLPDSLITIMDTNDYSAVPQQLKDQLNERYPGARRAVLKTGGDFPFLSRPDEVNLYLQLHLRRVGVEPRPDLVQGFSRNGSAGSSKGQKDGGDSFDDSPGDNGSGGHDHVTPHCGSESHDSDEQIPTNTMLANTVQGIVS